ncbi:putative cwf19-like protein [Septoria linicola]|nr:putative cwf19-like protein [Septoria linicola]
MASSMDVDFTAGDWDHMGLHLGRGADSANSVYSAIIGEVNGKFGVVFGQKLANMQKKQNFAFALIAGNLFADPNTLTDEEKQQEQQLLNGEIEVPLPTYFTIGTRALPAAALEKLRSNDGELCPNLSVLGRRSSVKTTEGFKIVTIGGNYSDSLPDDADDYTAKYTDEDIEEAKKYGDCDILVTSDWVAGIRIGSKNQYEGRSPPGTRGLVGVVTALKPRYHFSTSQRFFEREPFFHNVEPPRPITRFVSVAPYGTVKSSGTGAEKWIAAYNLEPSAPAPQTPPEGTTATPFVQTKKREFREDEGEAQNGYRFSNGGNRHDWDGNRGGRFRRGKRQRHDQQQPQECFFCLGKPSVEMHMITSIGENAYMTIAKGPLTTRKTFPDLNIPCHMLIIPVEHAPTLRALKDSPEETRKELSRYRDALHSMISVKSGKGADGVSVLGAVTWEISRGGGVHLHWQFLPVPVEMVEDGRIEAAFDVEAENQHYPRFAKTEAEKAAVQDGHYFRAMIWSEAGEKEIMLPLDETFRFDLQFGRRALGKLLGLEDRAHWRDVVQSQAEETADKDAFKEAFKEFDFSLINENKESVEGGGE